MNKVTEQNSEETHIHRWATEASTLGLRPGEWPDRLETDLGNKLPFVLVSMSEAGGSYRQENGVLELIVFND